MWRILVLGVLVVIVYFMVRSALRGLLGTTKEDGSRSVESPGRSSDMIQDPICGMFVPKEGSYFLQQDNQTYFFCSETCRANYQKKLTSA